MDDQGTIGRENASSVLIVDSDPAYMKETCELIASRGHRAWGARDLIAAVNFLTDQTPDVMLVELPLLEMDGADPLGDLRGHAPRVPVILTNSGPPDARFRTFSETHVIHGYHDKEHGDDGLLLWIHSAISTTRQQGSLETTREQLRRILEAVPDLHRIQSLDRVLETILVRLYGLFGGGSSFVAARASDPVGVPPLAGFPVELNDIDDYVIGAATNDYPKGEDVTDLEGLPDEALRRAIAECRAVIEERFGIVPLALGEHILGLAYLEGPDEGATDAEVLALFASQAAAAIRNAALYEMATVDATTRVFRKSFVLERLRESLKLAWRKSFPVTVLMVDIERFKQLNDKHGHVVGDRALRHMGARLKGGVRDSDVVGRFGGDEFLVVLLDADLDGAEVVAKRLHAALADDPGRPEGVPPLRMTLGMACLEPGGDGWEDEGFPDFNIVVETLVACADSAMYEARSEGWEFAAAPVLHWSDFTSTGPRDD